MFLLQNDYTRQEALRDLVISHPQLLSASAEAPNLRHLFRNRHDVLHLAISAANYSREIGRWEVRWLPEMRYLCFESTWKRVINCQ